jgi:F0F1-type ATP synthase assembly protein I
MTEFLSKFSLRTILALDAATCAIMGILLVSASGHLSDITRIPATFLSGAGLALLPIAVFMAFVARTATAPVWAVRMIVCGNILWVVGSVALPVLGLIPANALGWLFLFVQAAAVAVFTGLEWSSRPRLAAA